VRIVEAGAIGALLHAGFVVIGCGGGGIPVVEEAPGVYRGVEAVVDTISRVRLPGGPARAWSRDDAGLGIGKVKLADGEEVLGVPGEPLLCEGQRGITQHGGWRGYIASKKI
jgi:hypothetical protein